MAVACRLREIWGFPGKESGFIMDANAKALLADILSDLRSFSRQMDQAAQELKQMRGVGTELCASRLEVLADKYERARAELGKLS